MSVLPVSDQRLDSTRTPDSGTDLTIHSTRHEEYQAANNSDSDTRVPPARSS